MIEPNSVMLRVRTVELLSPTLKHVVLESVEGKRLPVGSAGSHVSLVLETGERTIRNSYSLVSGAEQDDRYELIVRRAERSRGGSVFVHDALVEGSIVAAFVPHNLFPIRSNARKHLLIGGGVGITPLLSYLPQLRRSGARLELHQIAAADEVALFERLLAPFASHDVHVHGGRDRLDVDALLARQPLGTHLYVCGPGALMERVEQAALGLGWPGSRIHRETFGAAGGEPFTVKLLNSGEDVAVGPDESMLEALERAGVPMPSLCRGGACGECRTAVAEGVPEHRDHFLSPEEQASNSCVMPCVSRSKTATLVLDI